MPVPADMLTRYRAKRDFAKTPEPKGAQAKKGGQRYLIQKHAATRLHYDFRLELDGVLKSWAVTRGPSLDPHDKRLAVEVEDHPVAYGGFEGVIPKGQYGGGAVMLWDEGSWEPIGDPRQGLKEGKLEFKLHGRRLRGEWTLVRMKPREKEKGRNNWLLIKHRDQYVREGDAEKFLAKNSTSIVSQRKMEEIAADADQVWPSQGAASEKKPPEKPVRQARKAAHTAKARAGKTGLPKFIPPQLATLSDAMPAGNAWVHEIKFDGYRMLAYLRPGQVKIYTRTGLDWTSKFQALADALGNLPVQSAVLDGEMVALDAEGVSSFKLLKEALSEEASDRLHYYVFDLLYLDGERLTDRPLLARKKALRPLLAGKSSRIFYSEHFAAPNPKLLEKICGLRLEGIVSKQADAPYRSGRGKIWLKTKCSQRQEFVIGGFTLPLHAGPGIGALLLGCYEKGKLVYAGKVGAGYDHETSRQLRRRLNRIKQTSPPFDGNLTAQVRRQARWVEPTLVCEVEFTEWTKEGRLRHPSFQGLREDKPATSVHRDRPMPGSRRAAENTVASTKAAKASAERTAPRAGNSKDVEVGGVRISHPDRIIYPGTAITKRQLAEYYLEVAEHILPHVENRPLSTVRCPEGSGEPCFFQRHVARGQSPYLHEVSLEVKGRKESYLMIKDVKGLITLAQWGVIELHPWGCRVEAPELPDRIVFDLDPDPDVPWKHLIEGVKEVRARMQEFGLEGFVKTTGGKGLHVTVPITPSYGWPTIKAFARAISESMQQDDPNRYIAKSSKAARRGKIFVDYLRNDVTATAVAPFSARAREGAPVATPLAWNELKSTLQPRMFMIETLPRRLQRQKKDPWEDFFRVRQQLAATHLRALAIPVGK